MKKNRRLKLGKMSIAKVRMSHRIKGGLMPMGPTNPCTPTIIQTQQATCANSCANSCEINCDPTTLTTDTTANGHTLGCPPNPMDTNNRPLA